MFATPYVTLQSTVVAIVDLLLVLLNYYQVLYLDR